MTIEWKEKVSESGLLVVLTGTSASGKDTTSEAVRQHEKLSHLKMSQVVTAASRGKRDGEVHGKDYWFYTLEKMREMERNGMFIEPLTQTGGPDDWKATEKKEILPILKQKRSVIWRIDLSRAAEVAKGGYFYNYLDAPTASLIEARTVVLRIDSDPDLSYEEIMEIRRKRDGAKFNREKYVKRDEQESAILAEHGHHFQNVIINKWGRLDETVDSVTDFVLNFSNLSK